MTKRPLVPHILVSIRSLYSESCTPGHVHWVLPSSRPPPPSESLMQMSPAHACCAPCLLSSSHRHHSSASRTSASGALTSCLDFPSHLAEPMVWQSYNAFPNTLYRLGLSAFSFPLSGKISPLMIPMVCIQPPAAEPICTKSHKQSKSISLQMHKS